ncbi:HVA22-like protein a isoform X3 [Vitis vinifera]|uniref:HVA22-like protein a isoform X3 n=1 Tax=Vitis vinifera TaxID=29760 RepID=UPI0005402A04|nr:HVA22-like protein a isoform X3 [Vitis vinifera]|eukprot:XP_010648040.1 PREDICTED: HVA22-like protein a isoform X3 [Vitis vinifera]
MGVMNVLKFSAACFDLLGWPLFALGYPLCSSIWVIETNSISDFRKLVTYWVLFSLISLFDHAFAKLLEWIPFWPYIKLMIICCLVMPHFDGSYYVYQHLVHPCLSMVTQVVMNWLFNESKKLSPSRENFLVAADQYIKENGAEALEKLLASKWQCEELNVAQKEIRVVEVTEIKNRDGAKQCEGPNVAKEEIKVTKVAQRTFGGTAKWVKRTELNLGETKSTTTCAEEIAERPAGLLNSHLQGERHKATSEQLNAKNQATKTNGSPSASVENKSDQTKNNGISASSTVKRPGEQHKCASSNGLEQKNNKIRRRRR